jgi:hydroxypyruvate isomerase
MNTRTCADISRRAMLGCATGATFAGVGAATMLPGQQAAAADDADWKITHGRIRQSVVHWCFNPMSVEQLAQASAAMGIESVELVEPKHWPMLKRHGLTCAIASSHGFVKGWNHKENWDFCREKVTASIEAAAEFGCPSVITFSGMQESIGNEEGLQNCIEGLKTVIGLAEKKKVNLCIEPLNTRVNVEMKGHPGYQCDTIEWGVKVCEAIGSPRMKILFDIYHTQIMQGDVIVRLRQFKDFIGHIHTAGVPGRNELDDTQEINYPAVMKAIVDIGYRGFVGQEFIPTWHDKLAALRHAARLCDVS